MSVHRGVSSGTRQVLAIAVGDVLSGLRITEALCKTKIDYVNVVLFLPDTNEEVVRLYVTMEEVTRMHEFNSLQL